MKFKRLAEYFGKIEKISSRLEMTRILASMFRETESEEIDRVVYLSLGRLRPKFAGIEFNMAEKMMLRAISQAYELNPKEVKKQFKQLGDLGEVVTRLGKKKRRGEKGLSVTAVYEKLTDIAVDEGQGSQERKVRNMASLIKNLDLLSAKFVVRIPVNKLRLGFSDMTVLDALSWLGKGDKSWRPQLERAFNVSADIGKLTAVFKKNGLKGVSGIRTKVGIPIRTAQAERLPNAEKMVEKLGLFAVEGKYDGLRVQIHVNKEKKAVAKKQGGLFGEQKSLVEIFSRNLDNMTAMFPDIVAESDKLPVETAILDGEAIAYNPQTGSWLPFQETIQRKRKHGVAEKVKQLPIKVIVYDLLYLDGQVLIEKPFQERRKNLEKIMTGFKGDLQLAEQEIVSEVDQLKKLLRIHLQAGLEGVMCKKLTTPYQAGSRNFNWVKFKKNTQGELVDTIDAVVMGYYPGKGRRTGFGIGAFLVGVPTSADSTSTEEVKIGSIAKIGTGLSDEQWREMKTRCDQFKIDTKPNQYIVDKNLAPDVWIKPEIVVEIMADEITRSPIHAFELALRFPRLVRFREKSVIEATTKKELEKLFTMQKVGGNNDRGRLRKAEHDSMKDNAR